MAVITPINAATYSTRVPYVTMAEFKNSPTGTDYLSQVPTATTQQARDVTLQQQIIRASAWADEICQQVLAATIDWESGSARVRRDEFGAYVITPELHRFPVIAVGAIQTGTDPASLTAWTGTGASLDLNLLRVPLAGTNPTGLTFTCAPPASHLAYAVQYVNGYANTTLTAAAAAGATSLTVANPLGIAPGQTLTLANQTATEYVTVDASYTPVVSTAPATVPLAAPTANAYADGDSCSAMPASIKEAVIHLTVLLMRSRGQYALVMSSVREQPGNVEDIAQGGLALYENAIDMLAAHIRTR